MARFEFEVVETRNYLCWYVVEAKTEEEAREKAQRGETKAEDDMEMLDVINREVSRQISPA